MLSFFGKTFRDRLSFLIVFGCFFILFAQTSKAQQKPPIIFGKVAVSDFDLPNSKLIDSNTNAVVIADIGSTSFVGNDQGWISHVFKRQTRIKVLNKKAIAVATIEVPLYKNDDVEEKLDKLEASTYNVEDGKVIETKLDKKDVFEEKTDKNHIEKKFAMPAVREGSIIEYSYTVISSFDYLPIWEFQHIEYPCLWSEYNVSIPSLVGYVFSRYGVHPFFIDKGDIGRTSFTIRPRRDHSELAIVDRTLVVSAGVLIHKWVMKELPLFKVENYISTPKNYIDRIEFQLQKVFNGEDTFYVNNNWKKTNEDLLNRGDFGSPLKLDNLNFSKEVETIVGNEQNDLVKAKEIYYYVQNNIRCNNHYNKFIWTSLRDVLKTNKGDVGEVNLLLAAFLRQAQIHADPVLLSTKEFGFNSSKYPMLDRLNYVICRVVIQGQVFFLDASQPLLGFGKLPENCYNGHARVICDRDSSSVYFWPDSIKESKVSVVFIGNSEKENGLMEGNFQVLPGYYASMDIREKIVNTGEKKYWDQLQTSYGPDMHLSQMGIDSLKDYEQPINLHYDFSFKNDSDANIIYFNPILTGSFRENPFKSSERTYPVEMPYPIDESYIFNMEIPNGYMVDELPKSVKVAYNGNEGFFEYLIQKTDMSVQMRCRIKLNNAYFPAEEYSALRDFFAYVVKKQSEQIVFKKKK